MFTISELLLIRYILENHDKNLWYNDEEEAEISYLVEKITNELDVR